jgi:nucleotide-binding universal stress UspA family protein
MSYRKIVSVINESTTSTVIARYAISLAAAGKAELVLYAAHEGGDDKILLHTENHLEHLSLAASRLDIPVTRITEVGKIGTLLPKRVQAEQADLVLYPLTSYKRYGADRQRKTVHTLLRSVGSDLAIMRAVSMARPHPRRILAPLGKVISNRERRLLFITELAECFHSHVTLFHLATERDAQGLPDTITTFRQQLQQHNVTVSERSGRGDVAKAITVEAVTRNNDLIVLGASRRGVLSNLFFGNPAGDVMHQPPCNTILFRAAL